MLLIDVVVVMMTEAHRECYSNPDPVELDRVALQVELMKSDERDEEGGGRCDGRR